MSLLTKLFLLALPGGAAVSGATITGIDVAVLIQPVTTSFTSASAQFAATLNCGPVGCAGVADMLTFRVTGTGLTAPTPITLHISGIENYGSDRGGGTTMSLLVRLELVPQELNLFSYFIGNGTVEVGQYNQVVGV